MSPVKPKAPAKKATTVVSSDKGGRKAAPEVAVGSKKRELRGIVVSDKMQKTIVVTVDRKIRHGLYQKYVTRTKRFKAHDEGNKAKTGDLVVIIESRPLSKDKCWALKEILRTAGQAATVEANA